MPAFAYFWSRCQPPSQFSAGGASARVSMRLSMVSVGPSSGMAASAARVMPPLVTFDRPYLMVVTDRATGEPLFMARVADPSRT